MMSDTRPFWFIKQDLLLSGSFYGADIGRKCDAVKGEDKGEKDIEQRQRHRGKCNDFTDRHGQTEQSGAQSERADPTGSFGKINIIKQACLPHQEKSEREQAKQIEGSFRHTGNLRILLKHLNAVNQCPNEREQKGEGVAVGDAFPEIADSESDKDDAAENRHRDLNRSEQHTGRKHGNFAHCQNLADYGNQFDGVQHTSQQHNAADAKGKHRQNLRIGDRKAQLFLQGGGK